MNTKETERPRTHSIRYLIDILFRRKWVILLCLCGVLAPIVYHNEMSSPVYQAKTTIVVQESRSPIPSTADLSESIFGKKTFISNQIQEIESRTLAEEVVRNLPEEVKESFPVPDPLPRSFNFDRLLASQIRNSISANQIREADVIIIQVESYDAEAGAVIANTVTKVLQDRSLDVNREAVTEVRKLIGKQLKDYKELLEAAEEDLKSFKEENKVVLLDDEAREILRRITEAERLYNSIISEKDGVSAGLEIVEKRLLQEKDKIIPSATQATIFWSNELQGMTSSLNELKEKLFKLQSSRDKLEIEGYSEDHQKIKELDEDIERAKTKLAQEALKIIDQENVLDPLSQMQDLAERSIQMSIDLEVLKSREKALRTIIEAYEISLKLLPDKELQLTQLTRSKEVNNSIYMMLRRKYEEARINEAGKLANIRVIDPAEVPSGPIRPRKGLNLLIGLIVGSILGLGLALFLESLDTSLKTIEDVENYVDLPMMGSIMLMKNVANGKSRRRRKDEQDAEVTNIAEENLITAYNPNSPYSEGYRTIRTNLQFSGVDRQLRTVLLTSPEPQDGKSITTANLAIAAAQVGLMTLVVDTDLRRTVLHHLFNVDREPGITNILTKSAEMDESIRHTEIENLDLLPCGALPPNPSEILASQSMRDFLEELKRRYDVVFFDSPPAIAVTDASVLGAQTDGVSLVLRSGKTSAEAALRAKTLLENGQAKVIGTILNGIDIERTYGKYGYYYYHYYYYYSSDEDGDGEVRKGKKRRTHRRQSRSISKLIVPVLVLLIAGAILARESILEFIGSDVPYLNSLLRDKKDDSDDETMSSDRVGGDLPGESESAQTSGLDLPDVK